ncbi:MAG: AAA family ATPase [Lachnospiraceae bacterium]|nr:AAA family ATPase [Lachnospiraceae bacterium]
MKNLALIESADITFNDGLNIMTGETGAGKSVIIGSVAAALGGHADQSLIRHGAEYALIELTFDTAGDQRVSGMLSEMGIDDAGDEVLIQRKISEKRSVIRVNGETVTLKAIRSIAPYLMDIYGQKEHQTLLSSASQADVLDSWAGEELSGLKEKISGLFTEIRGINEELSEEERDDRTRQREADLAEYEINEIDSADLKKGEYEELQ